MSWQPLPPEPEEQPKTPGFKETIKHPAFIVMIIFLAIGIWFGTSFMNIASNPTKENSLNYSGMAEVLDVGSSPSKCIAHVRREDGRETRQDMRKSDCGKFQKGDTIKMEYGQYVSTSPLPISPVR